MNILIKFTEAISILLSEKHLQTLVEYKKSSIFATLLEKGITIRIHDSGV